MTEVTTTESLLLHRLRGLAAEISAEPTADQRQWAAEAALQPLRHAATMVDPDSWWTADHYDSDRHYHAYCGRCLNQIPGWLMRYLSEIPDPTAYDSGDGFCDGCKKDMPDKPA